VLLRGVNWSGLEYGTAGPRPGDIAAITADWGANIIRLPFNQMWALEDEDYLVELDRAIGGIAQCGAYTLLDLQWLSAEEPYGADNFVAPLPNPGSVDVWRMLARRYRDHPAVLFDIFNEPHDPLPDDPYPLVAADGTILSGGRVSMIEWQPWALELVDAIRGVHPEALIFVSGVEWGYDLRGFPLDRPHLVYSTHVYRERGEQWHDAFGHLAGEVPVFAAEWGGTDLDWGRRLAAYFDELEMGWTAWSWCDHPHLQRDGRTTEFGELVRGCLRDSPERLRK
jgi:endoglucanase